MWQERQAASRFFGNGSQGGPFQGRKVGREAAKMTKEQTALRAAGHSLQGNSKADPSLCNNLK